MTLLGDPRTPDGRWPLEVGRPGLPLLEPAMATTQLRCFIAAHCTRYGLTVHEDCRRQIMPGEHYLRHLQQDSETGDPTGLVWSYCAPCAVRECRWWDVREAGAA
jgi:hypothetical protein